MSSNPQQAKHAATILVSGIFLAYSSDPTFAQGILIHEAAQPGVALIRVPSRPTLAHKFTDQFSIGMGLCVAYGYYRTERVINNLQGLRDSPNGQLQYRTPTSAPAFMTMTPAPHRSGLPRWQHWHAGRPGGAQGRRRRARPFFTANNAQAVLDGWTRDMIKSTEEVNPRPDGAGQGRLLPSWKQEASQQTLLAVTSVGTALQTRRSLK